MIRIAFRKEYVHPLPVTHKFPMSKYDLIHQQLQYEGTYSTEHFFRPDTIAEEAILRVHTSTYWEQLRKLQLDAKAQRKTGFIHNEALIHRECFIMGGTLECTQFAIDNGIALNIAGGTHHAYADSGEGFCLLNDNAIAAAHLIATTDVARILIVDLDVHQGNGTARIFEQDDRIFTFSMHGKNNYPFKKEHSNLDLALEDGCKDDQYLEILEEHLHQIMESLQPEFLFYQCGVDVLESDRLGKLSLSLEGCKQRDRIVLETARNKNIPIVCNLGGGYSPTIKTIVEAHCNTFRLAKSLFD